MISLRFEQLAEITGGKLNNEQHLAAMFNGVSIDSRSIQKGELFIAIKGEFNDGHDYIVKAVESNASGILLQSNLSSLSDNVPVVTVDDSHRAMIALASAYRESFDAKVIGITGSNGKTTTKEFVAALISSVEKKTFCSPGNLNNLFGVPLALFKINDDAKVVVLEMGISTKDEMPRLTELVKPDLAIFTNVGASHLEFLKSVEEVAQAKLQMLKKSPAETLAIVNKDDEVLYREAKNIRSDIITFALENNADYTADLIERDEDGASIVTIRGNSFRLPLLGKHQVYNLLAAYAAFDRLGYSFDKIDTMKINLTTAPMRGQIEIMEDTLFVADCYNANPASMQAGLHSFADASFAGRQVVIVGDMLELGDESEQYHQEVGRLIVQLGFDLVITVGQLSESINSIVKDADIDSAHFDNSQAAATQVRELINRGDAVYLKASRGIALEKVLEQFDGGGNN